MLLASDYTKLLELFSFVSLEFKWDTTVDHLALAFESHTIYSHSISSLLLLIDYEQVQYHRKFD